MEDNHTYLKHLTPGPYSALIINLVIITCKFLLSLNWLHVAYAKNKSGV